MRRQQVPALYNLLSLWPKLSQIHGAALANGAKESGIVERASTYYAFLGKLQVLGSSPERSGAG
jgi:hypothetical protein